MTSCGKSLEERADGLSPAVLGDFGAPLERIFRLRDEAKALRDAVNAKLAANER
jgi:hypothetical protein